MDEPALGDATCSKPCRRRTYTFVFVPPFQEAKWLYMSSVEAKIWRITIRVSFVMSRMERMRSFPTCPSIHLPNPDHAVLSLFQYFLPMYTISVVFRIDGTAHLKTGERICWKDTKLLHKSLQGRIAGPGPKSYISRPSPYHCPH